MNTQITCNQCYQSITNPICVKCHSRQLAIWLNDNQVPPKIISNIMKKVRQETQHNFYNDGLCILCNKELLTLCTYCFFFRVEKALSDINTPSPFIDNFLEIFNYKLYGDDSFSIKEYKKD